MPVTIANLAKAILNDLKQTDLQSELHPTESQLVSGLERLIADRYLDGDLLKGGNSVGAGLLDAVKSAVQVAQGESGGLLTVDKLFGVKTLNWLQFGMRCFGALRKEWQKPAYQQKHGIPGDVTFATKEIRYQVVELPTWPGGQPLPLLWKAWNSWMKVCGVIATQSPTERNANVIVRVTNLDGPSNVLGDAHVGPPERARLELRFDRAEQWTDAKFEGTACHEIGHLLGLTHTGQAGQLMSSSLATIITPQDEDTQRAQQIWGPPHTIGVIPPTPGIEM